MNSGIVGAHVIISSKRPEADRAFLREVLKFPHVDVGGGWLIFGLPPCEVAIHPSAKNNEHGFYLMVADVKQFVDSMKTRKVRCSPVKDQGWGLLTIVNLPGGGRLVVYEPRHARPQQMKATRVSAARRRTRG
jgi:hypothetical protein